ncbi:MAG: TolC family protein [Bacteroidales bacterium]|nr:TolC family protein [Bacteroidales bacterium]
MMKKTLTLIMGLAVFGTAQAQQAWSLRQCITYALEHNISIKQQENTVESNRISLNTSKNSRLPGLQASASQSMNFGRGLTADNTYANRNTMSTGFDLGTSVSLYTGGQMTHDIRQKEINLQAALVDLNRAKDDISMQIASTYLEVLYQKDMLAVAKNQLELAKLQESRLQSLLQTGKIAETEVVEAHATVASDELQVTQAENQVQLALLNLSQLLELQTPEGLDVETPVIAQAQDVILPLPDVIYAEANGIKPQVQAQVLRLKSAEESIEIAKAGKLPRVSLSGGLGTNYYHTSGFPSNKFSSQLKDNLSKYIGLSVSVPIFNKYATRNQIKTAKLQYQTQQLQLEETRKGLYKEIQQAYYNALAAQKQCVSSEAAEKASQSAFELVSKKYENGKATNTEFQESKTRLLKAEADYLQAKYTFLFRTKILEFYRGVALE